MRLGVCALLLAMAAVGLAQDRAKEIALGKGLAGRVRADVQVVEDAAVQRYVEGVAGRLIAVLPADHYQYTFTVFVNQKALEPRALPGGFVFIPTNLLVSAQSEGEFAGMLAHAMAHVELRHGMRVTPPGQVANLPTIPLIFVDGWGRTDGDDSAFIPVGYRKFRRELEVEADQRALHILADSGYPVAALVGFIDRIAVDRNSPPISIYPPRAERLAALRAGAAGLPVGTEPPLEGLRAVQELIRPVTPVMRPPTLLK